MQTISSIENESAGNTAGLNHPYALFQIPSLDKGIFDRPYQTVSYVLNSLTPDEKQELSGILLSALEHQLIDKSVVEQQEAQYRADRNEQKLFYGLKNHAEQVVTAVLPPDYASVNITTQAIQLTSYDINELCINTSNLVEEHRWVIYSSLEVISHYMYPMMLPRDWIMGQPSILSAIHSSGEFEEILNEAQVVTDVESLRTLISDKYDDGYFGMLLDNNQNDLCECIKRLIAYECAVNDMTRYSDFCEVNKLRPTDPGCIDRHLQRLKMIEHPFADTLQEVLTLLLKKPVPLRLETFEEEEYERDTYSMCLRVMVIDDYYESIITLCEDEIYDEMQNVGEPIACQIPLDKQVLDSLAIIETVQQKLFETEKKVNESSSR